MNGARMGGVAWLLAGLLTAALGLGGVAAMGLATGPAAASEAWRPPCARALGPSYAALDVRDTDAVADARRIYLFGIDRSPSNAEHANAELAAAVEFAAALPSSDGFGVLFVSDRSDRSSTPDFPLEPPIAARTAVSDPLPCAPDCGTKSLFEHTCHAQIEAALATRTAAVQREHDLRTEAQRSARATRLRTWAEGVRDYWPEPGTSLLRFWHKVADLPAVRRDSTAVTVVLASDLEEARTSDKRAILAFERAGRGGDACPADNPLPATLAGIDVVLLQTVTDGSDPARAGTTWERLLRCRGATVQRYRYADATALVHYMEGPRGPAPVPAEP